MTTNFEILPVFPSVIAAAKIKEDISELWQAAPLLEYHETTSDDSHSVYCSQNMRLLDSYPTVKNIILKVNLYKEIDAKDLGKYKFNFFLVTGVGDVGSKGDVTIGKATVLPLKTTLCGLTRIKEKFKNKKYEIVLNKEKKGDSEAAKIFLQLKRGSLTLLDLEIRYKGAFTPQPQFQGTLHPDFKKLLEDECGL